MIKARPNTKISRIKDNSQIDKIIISRNTIRANKNEKNSSIIIQWGRNCIQFLREVKIELRKVVWPSRRQAIASTGVVLILVVLISIFLGIVDALLSRLIHMLLIK